MREVVFWQSMISPHMVSLADALAARGLTVSFVAAEAVSANRAEQGWTVPQLRDARLRLVSGTAHACEVAASFPATAVHLLQGVRSNGYLSRVVRTLRQLNARCGALMEAVDDRPPLGVLKHPLYTWALSLAPTRPDFVLAIGARTPDWITARHFSADKVFPFCYFLDAKPGVPIVTRRKGPFQIGFVGRLIELKRLDLLIGALSGLPSYDFQLVVIGHGPLEISLRRMAESRLGKDRVCWLGRLPMNEARVIIAALDCLVLPSNYDGWGAVVSEALLAGVPAICSDNCGVAAAVRASRSGGVFPVGDERALRGLLKVQIESGPSTAAGRAKLARWARCLSCEVGAEYLEGIIAAVYEDGIRPGVPWDAMPLLRMSAIDS